MTRQVAALVIALAWGRSSADVHIIQELHADEYYSSGVITPALDRESDVWIGTGRLAYIDPAFHLVVDIERNTFTFANRRDSTYVETKLPFEWHNFVPEQLVGFLAQYRTHGTVERTDEKAKIGGWDCRCYTMTSWINTETGRYNEQESRLWVTKDFPIDWDRYRAMNLHLLRATNYEDSLVTAVGGIEGFIVRTEAERFDHGFSVQSVEEVVESGESEPDADVYTLPGHFKKKALLSMADLAG